MGINLLNLEPHKVSRDLSGYITYIYGPKKIGKTTFAAQMPGMLLCAFEKGYNALAGVIAQDITNWGEMRMVAAQLKKPEVKKKFKGVAIDTIDIAVDLATKYVCGRENVDTISQIPWGGGWTMVKKELEECFRSITQAGYAVIFISHDKDKTFKKEDGTEFNQIVPTISATYNEIISGMVDIYGYAHSIIVDGQPKRVLTLRSFDGSIDCGCRFKYIEPEIDFSYPALVKALNEAIDKEAELSNGEFVTEDRNVTETKDLDFDALLKEFNTMTEELNEKDKDKFKEFYAPRITEIIERYLGKGKKINNANRSQAEQVSLIVYDVKELIDSNKAE